MPGSLYALSYLPSFLTPNPICSSLVPGWYLLEALSSRIGDFILFSPASLIISGYHLKGMASCKMPSQGIFPHRTGAENNTNKNNNNNNKPALHTIRNLESELPASLLWALLSEPPPSRRLWTTMNKEAFSPTIASFLVPPG